MMEDSGLSCVTSDPEGHETHSGLPPEKAQEFRLRSEGAAWRLQATAIACAN